MTTSPVMSINDELLDDLQQKAKAAVPGCCGEMIPTGVEYGGQREMMCCEAWQQCDVAVDALDLLALVEHIRSLTARMSYIERNFVGATFDYDGDGMAAMVVRISDRVSVSRDAAAVLDAAIAQEGQSHE